MKEIFQKRPLSTKYLCYFILLLVGFTLFHLLWIAQKTSESGVGAIDDSFLPLIVASFGVLILSALLCWDFFVQKGKHRTFAILFILINVFLFYSVLSLFITNFFQFVEGLFTPLCC